MSQEVEVETEVETKAMSLVDQIIQNKEVVLGKYKVKLGLPRSRSLFYEINTATSINNHRAWAAALGVCWDNGQCPGLPGKYSETYNVLVYGGKVIDTLLERGISYDEIIIASAASFCILREKANSLTSAMVDGAEKN